MADENRPNPDALLSSIQREEAAKKRGRLKVFFGMAPGEPNVVVLDANGQTHSVQNGHLDELEFRELAAATARRALVGRTLVSVTTHHASQRRALPLRDSRRVAGRQVVDFSLG